MGNRKKAKRRASSKPESFYSLSEVRQMVDQGKILLRPNALDDAQRDFGWDTRDILDALRKLQPRHFYKSDTSAKKPAVVLDFYKAPGLKGEDVYTHFYIDDENSVLVVNSFKRV
jgi:hypothetical protein